VRPHSVSSARPSVTPRPSQTRSSTARSARSSIPSASMSPREDSVNMSFAAGDEGSVLRLYGEVAESGDRVALFTLGWMYLFGMEGAEKSDKKARLYLTAAADKGHDLAQYHLGMLFITSDSAKAFDYIKQSALQGYSLAAYQVGRMYSKGIGVPQSDKDAHEWFKRSAENGNALAKKCLAKASA
jgi:TPR repeat protein